jgi:hypothetical protein
VSRRYLPSPVERRLASDGRAHVRSEASELNPAPLGSPLPVVRKTELRDLLPDLRKTNGYMVDKVEGFTVDAAGNAFAVTDNDGVDDASGETLFMRLGKL